MKRNILFFVLFYVGIVLSDQALAQTGNPIVVRIDQPTSDIQSTMWGIFFEDINLAADGGIYAELVKNRSFEFAKPLMGWKILKKDPTEGLLILNRLSLIHI